MLEQVIIVVHVLTAIAIVGLILLQQGKGADMGASFGSGSSQTVFGAQGSGNMLTKGTAILSALFFVTSLGLAVYARNQAEVAGQVGIPVPSVVEDRSDMAPPPENSPVEGDIPEFGSGEVVNDVPVAQEESSESSIPE